MWKRKRSVNQLHGWDLLDRARKLGIRFTSISEDSIKSQIREAEKVLRERRRERWNETLKLVLYAVVGLAVGVTIMTVIDKGLRSVAHPGAVSSSLILFRQIQPDISLCKSVQQYNNHTACPSNGNSRSTSFAARSRRQIGTY